MMTDDLKQAARTLIDLAFQEDLKNRGDITTLALGADDGMSNASIRAKQSGVVCGLDIVDMVFRESDPSIILNFMTNDGDVVQSGQPLLTMSGSAGNILVAERTALNFLGRLSGISTFTRQFVNAVSNTKTKILDTRKTTPGWRLLEKYSVNCGGGENHRIGLYDMFLIKENHITAAGGIANAVRQCRDYMRAQNFQAAIEVETQNCADVKESLSLHIDRIMLDNMTLEQMRECVEFVHGNVPLEASGNVSLDRVRAIAETGVDYISIGALTHSVKSFDVTLLFR